MDPNARLPGMGRTFEDLTKLPPGIQVPAGVDKSKPKEWYVQSYTTADGRQFFEFYKRGNTGKPGTATPDPVHATVEGPTNTEQAERFKKEQEAATKPPPAPTTRTINGVPHQVTGKDANGQDIWSPVQTTTGTATATTTAGTKPAIPPGGSSETQGTPIKDAQGNITGWDNNRPREVIKDKDGNVIWSEELTGADLTAWRANQQANQPQTGEVRKPVPNRPGWTQITRVTKQGGNETTTTVYVGPDGKEVPTLPEPSATVRIPVDGHPGIYLVTSKNGQNQSSHYENEAGQTVPQPAAAPTYNVQPRTINGQSYTVITKTPKDGGQPTITNYGPDGKPVAALPTEGQRKLPPGMPALDLSSPARARETYNAQFTWAQQAVANGELSSKDALDILTASKDAGDGVIKAEQDQIANTRATRTQDIQQEGNRLTASTAQFANSRLGVDEIAKYAPKGGTQAGTAFLTNLLTQGLMNQGTRGNVGAASPTPTMPGLPNPAALSELGQPGDPTQAGADAARQQAMAAPSSGSAMLDRMAATAQAATRVGPERTAEIRANPVFSPKAPVGSPLIFGSQTPATPPAVQGTPSPLGDTGAPPVGMVDPSTLPPFLRGIYGRSVLDQILGGAA